MLRSSATHYYSADGLGSVTSLTDGSGAVAASYTYDAFGNLAASTGSLTNPFRYTAREWDSEAGLYFYRARYYDESSGRFLSEDPIAFAAGPNFYSYAWNVPTVLTDPTGFQPPEVIIHQILTRLGISHSIAQITKSDVEKRITLKQPTPMPDTPEGQQAVSDMRHCTASCEVAQQLSVLESRLYGYAHEGRGLVNDFTTGRLKVLLFPSGPTSYMPVVVQTEPAIAADPRDVQANEAGITCFGIVKAGKSRNCQTCCAYASCQLNQQRMQP